MTKEAQNPNDEEATVTALCHLIIRHSFDIRHLAFVILWSPGFLSVFKLIDPDRSRSKTLH